MIVKVQASQATNSEHRQMLIYDQSRNIFYQADLTDEVAKLLHGRPKAYFNAAVRDTIIHLGAEAPAQKW